MAGVLGGTIGRVSEWGTSKDEKRIWAGNLDEALGSYWKMLREMEFEDPEEAHDCEEAFDSNVDLEEDNIFAMAVGVGSTKAMPQGVFCDSFGASSVVVAALFFCLNETSVDLVFELLDALLIVGTFRFDTKSAADFLLDLLSWSSLTMAGTPRWGWRSYVR